MLLLLQVMERRVWAWATVVDLRFNHLPRISALRESPHSCPCSGEAGWKIHCVGVMLSSP